MCFINKQGGGCTGRPEYYLALDVRVFGMKLVNGENLLGRDQNPMTRGFRSGCQTLKFGFRTYHRDGCNEVILLLAKLIHWISTFLMIIDSQLHLACET